MQLQNKFTEYIKLLLKANWISHAIQYLLLLNLHQLTHFHK